MPSIAFGFRGELIFHGDISEIFILFHLLAINYSRYSGKAKIFGEYSWPPDMEEGKGFNKPASGKTDGRLFVYLGEETFNVQIAGID